MVYFPDIVTACQATVALKDGPVDGAELLDRLALKAVENKEGILDFIKEFDETTTAIQRRATNRSALSKKIGRFTEEHLELVTGGASVALKLVDGMHGLLGTKNFGKICDTARSISGNRIPQWTPAMPKGDPVEDSVTEVTIRVLKKAGYGIIFPEGMKNFCCGTPWGVQGIYGNSRHEVQRT